ncbi:hypothetical protein NLO83_04445 [Pseudomonas tremae]|uniref:hypothetical protein n=1 Tax=Pseudomonas syringae group TaxID=136849 RepID=UPI0011C3F202|nr:MULTISPECIES: hypothetical protein [Pseudomonas syringae group]MCQ3014858.1 hypothetical protein [Pseudomonas tremae]QGL56612.1 hypothetical protein POR16_09745 [Pseudomonas coronafaciens pv. oryzae str. 1_6]
MKTGRCGLCKKDGIIRKSHLVPKAAYRLVRDPKTQGGGSPLRIDTLSRRAGRTDKQVTADFLCGACEILFSRFGEAPVSKLWGSYTSFPMLDILGAYLPASISQRRSIYNTGSLPLEVLDALYYFGVSIVWRAAEWPANFIGVNSCAKVFSLSKLKVIESYLLNPSGRIGDIFMVVDVNTQSGLNGMFSFPSKTKAEHASAIQFDLLGLRFIVFFGLDFPDEIRRLKSDYGDDMIVTTSDHMQSNATKQIARFLDENNID